MTKRRADEAASARLDPAAPLSDPTKAAAAPAVAAYLRAAKDAIDAVFGEGHAAQHPEIVAAFLQAAAIEAAANGGRDAAGELRDAIVSLKPRLF